MRRCRRPIRGLFVVVLGLGLAAMAARVPSPAFAQAGQGPLSTLMLKVPNPVPSETSAPPSAGAPLPSGPGPQNLVVEVPSQPAPSAVDVDGALSRHLRDDSKREAVDKAISVLLNKAAPPPSEPSPQTPSAPPPAIPSAAPARVETPPVAKPRDNSFNPIWRLLERMGGNRAQNQSTNSLPAPPALPPIAVADSEEQEPLRSTLRPTLSLDDAPRTLPPALPAPPGASSPKPGPIPPESPPRTAGPPVETATLPMETCATCGHRRPFQRLQDKFAGPFGHGKCTRCGADWRCVPGQEPCGWCDAEGPLGHFFCSIYDSICCIDPCYEPKWRQVPNAALFVDGARPITQTEVRWNAGRGGVFPDRSEFIWARADGMGRGPKPLAAGVFGGDFNFDELVVITETAKDKLSAIIEFPYRAVDHDNYPHGAGFGNMGIGTKTLLCDCELMQFSMMMKTYLPIGNALKGVGNGHVAIEPSLLFALKLTCDCYIQGQFIETIPIGGDQDYAGSVFHTHFSVNNVLYRFGPDFPLVGTFETATYSFQDGAYTDPILGPYQSASKTTYVSMGPGLRLMFCDKLDIGFGALIAVSGDHFAREYYRTSVRLRF